MSIYDYPYMPERENLRDRGICKLREEADRYRRAYDEMCRMQELNRYTGSHNTKKEKTTMSKVNILSKLFLDDDTKTLIEAGILDNELEIANNQLVMMFFVQKYKKEMAEFARTNILEKEATEKKK